MVNELWTISTAAAPTTQDSSSAETGKGTVHTSQRSTEDIETEAKTNGKESSHKEKYKIVKTNNNDNLGFMDVTKTVKNFEINNENNQVPRVCYPANLLAQEIPRKETIDLKEVWTASRKYKKIAVD